MYSVSLDAVKEVVHGYQMPFSSDGDEETRLSSGMWRRFSAIQVVPLLSCRMRYLTPAYSSRSESSGRSSSTGAIAPPSSQPLTAPLMEAWILFVLLITASIAYSAPDCRSVAWNVLVCRLPSEVWISSSSAARCGTRMAHYRPAVTVGKDRYPFSAEEAST